MEWTRKKMGKGALGTLGFVGVWLLTAGTVHAQDPSTLRVTGEATRSVAPDVALVEIGVISDAKRAAEASEANAEKLSAALAALRHQLGPTARLETASYSLEPRYERRQGSASEIAGYRASNVIEVRTTQLDQLGQVIDAATRSGANQVRSLRFELDDPSAVLAQALAEAAGNARVKAAALAGALDLRIERVLSVEEAGAPVVPERVLRFAQAASVSNTPVEPGRVDVRGSVTITFELSR